MLIVILSVFADFVGLCFCYALLCQWMGENALEENWWWKYGCRVQEIQQRDPRWKKFKFYFL